MKTKKLNFRKPMWISMVGIILKRYWKQSLILFALLLCFVGFSVFILSSYMHRPNPIVVDIQSFGGLVLSQNQCHGKPSSLFIETSFDEAKKWRSDAVLLYGSIDANTVGIEVYKASTTSRGTYLYSNYTFVYTGAWQNGYLVYNPTKKTITTYPYFMPSVVVVSAFIMFFLLLGILVMILILIGKIEEISKD